MVEKVCLQEPLCDLGDHTYKYELKLKLDLEEWMS